MIKFERVKGQDGKHEWGKEVHTKFSVICALSHDVAIAEVVLMSNNRLIGQ